VAEELGRRPDVPSVAMSEFPSLEVDPGLCLQCAFVRVNRTRRGTTYIRCTRATWDERLVKYPRLPVISCVGYQDRSAG